MVRRFVFWGLVVSFLLQAGCIWENEEKKAGAKRAPIRLPVAMALRAAQKPAAVEDALVAINRLAERTCLATAIYYEARGETVSGQKAVAMVIFNRSRSPAYPPSICGVVFQNARWRNRCQFSFACTGISLVPKNAEAWQLAFRIAKARYSCAPECNNYTLVDKTNYLAVDATHYYANYVSPKWAEQMHRHGQIGRHIFLSPRSADGV